MTIPQEAVDMEMRSSSMSSVVQPQLVPSRISVVLVEDAEIRGAECLASIPEDQAIRLLARAARPASMTVCEDCIMMPPAVGTLSPSISDYVGPVGPCGTLSPSDSDSAGPVGPDGLLSSSDLAGILFPVVPVGIPFPVGPDGPVFMALSDSIGPVGPDGTLSSSVFAGMLIPAAPAGLLWW